MRLENMKKILFPALAAVALLVSCSDWTDPENKDFLPAMSQYDPATLAAIRDFKASEHLVTMMHINGTATAPNRQNQHPMAMPDSVDFLLLNNSLDLHPTFVAEVAEVRKQKGTRTLQVIDYTTIRNTWETLKEEAAESGNGGDFTEENFAEYCRMETEKRLDCCNSYGLDGVVASYLGGFDSRAAEPFVRAIDAWAQAHPDKQLFFRGYPAYIVKIENQELVSRCRYILILTEDAKASVAISRMVRDQLEDGVPSDRIVLEASVPALADGGEDAQIGATARVAAEWVVDPNTYPTVKCDKLGLALSNAQEDYFNAPTYKRVREALAILNSVPAETNPEN